MSLSSCSVVFPDDVKVLFDDGVRYVAPKVNVRKRVSQ